MKKNTKVKDKEEVSDKDPEMQAIILADSYVTKFWPITMEGPRALIPIGNVTMIDYVVQFLLINKIKNIIIFGTAFKDKIEEYFKKYKAKEFSIKIVSSEDCKSIGDALRNIERMNLIKGDFILVKCDVVANFKLEKAILQHKMKKTENKANIMTKIYKRLPYGHPLRTDDDDIAIVVDQYTNQLLQIENLKNNKNLYIKNKMDLKQGNNNYKIYYDLYDTNVTICSIDVLHHFMDNFDFNNFRDDYIKDLLTSDILEDKINICLVNDEEYSATVQDLRVYKHVLHDLIAQWVQPLVIHKLGSKIRDKTHYHYYSDNLYISNDVQRSLHGTISNNSIIGKNTTFAEKVDIVRSSLGNDCKIGKNVKIIDSVIWDNVTIHENCVIKGSLICSDVIIGKNSSLLEGCLLSHGVIVKENINLPQFSVASLYTVEKGKPKGISSQKNNEFFEKGELFDLQSCNNLKPYERFNSEYKISEDEFNDYESPSEESSEADDLEPNNEFLKEVIETIRRVHTKESTIKTCIFELNNLKYGENKTFADCIQAFLHEIFGELLKIEENASPDIITKKIKELVEFWSQLMIDFTHAVEDGVKLINELESFCNKNLRFKSSFHVILQILFMNKILDANKIITWGNTSNVEEESSKYYLELCDKFLKYLKSLNEDSDEEEEEEEEEEKEN